MEAAGGEALMVTSLAIVRVIAAVFDGSATLVACTSTAVGDGRIPGAVKSPPEETVPSEALPPITPFTDHKTAVFVVFETVAVSVVAAPSKTEVFVALTLTLIGGLVGDSGGFVPATFPHPLAIKAARSAASSSHAPREALRCGGDSAVNTAAFESKANARGQAAQSQFCELASRKRLCFRTEYKFAAQRDLTTSGDLWTRFLANGRRARNAPSLRSRVSF
jgi:hypothetical protein